MQLDITYIIEGLLRWLHVFSGIMWIGLLYFFNFVNANFAPTLDAESKKKVVPELMPRALFFFRWGAAITWITGVLLIMIVYYHHGLLFEAGNTWSALAFTMIAVVFILGFFIYDLLCKNALKDNRALFWVGWLLATSMVYVMRAAGFSFRGYAIHLGALFGTIMAANVWMRIWPAQKKIITAVKEGQKPEDATVALAGARSKHNTYMSVPLVFMMLSQHATWASKPYMLSIIVLAGWGACFWLYGYSKKIKGF